MPARSAPAIVAFGPRSPKRMAACPAAQFMTVFGNSIAFTRYGRASTSVARL